MTSSGEEWMDFEECSMRKLESVVAVSKFDDEGVVTNSSIEQIKVEESIIAKYDLYIKSRYLCVQLPVLHKKEHIQFVTQSIAHLSAKSEPLDASRAWIVFWSVNSLSLLKYPIADSHIDHIIGFIRRLQCPAGGFGGGPGQFPHLAPTYAAVSAICSLGTEKAYAVINRSSLYQFLKSLKNPNGSFSMHEGGEVDVRGVYCALAVAKLTNIYTDELFENSSTWVKSCQNYEGGFAAGPGLEAHGGYTHCSLAALIMLNKSNDCDLPSLIRWIVSRQTKLEGGFNGRTNKLVDGCYSFWQGGSFPLIHQILLDGGDLDLNMRQYLFSHVALQEYLLICCQYTVGGLVDKPGKRPDLYHTFYCLSGLSIAQHFICNHFYHENIVGPSKNELDVMHPVFNITLSSAEKAMRYFNCLKAPVTEG